MWKPLAEHKKVGKVLADLRIAAGIGQTALAAMLDKPQSFVSSYETGQRRIDIPEFIAIVSALDAKPTEVFQRVLRAMQVRSR